MNKVAKEQLQLFKPTKVEEVEFDLRNRNYLHSVLAKNEQRCFTELGTKMMKAGKSGIFDTWSMQNQDLVQATAHAYGERIVSCSSIVLNVLF